MLTEIQRLMRDDLVYSRARRLTPEGERWLDNGWQGELTASMLTPISAAIPSHIARYYAWVTQERYKTCTAGQPTLSRYPSSPPRGEWVERAIERLVAKGVIRVEKIEKGWFRYRILYRANVSSGGGMVRV